VTGTEMQHGPLGAGDLPPTRRGLIYVATRAEAYVEQAAISARSVKAAMADLPVVLFTDQPAPEGTFDLVVPVESCGDGYRDKLLCMSRTPFERTLFLDADTYVVSDLQDLYRLLDHFDLGAAHAPNRVVLDLDQVPLTYPELNTGVILYRQSPAVAQLLAAWVQIYDSHRARHPRSFDQPAFRQALYMNDDIRVATLAPEYNCRFIMGGYYNRPVVILHGALPSAFAYQHVAQVLNAEIEGVTSHRVHVGPYVIGFQEGVMRLKLLIVPSGDAPGRA
jgi:hypothetical protein